MRTATGQAINDKVREFFGQGYKSNNKLYFNVDEENPKVDAARLQRRAENKVKSYEAAVSHIGEYASYSELAGMVAKMPVGEQSGNCTEMAVLAAHYAMTLHNVPANLCHIARITDPGDHCFALFSLPLTVVTRNFRCVQFMSNGAEAHTWMVVDPWLNVVCYAHKYHLEAGKRLEVWAGKGKHIGWNGPRGLLFYAAGGHASEYKEAFLNYGPVSVSNFVT